MTLYTTIPHLAYCEKCGWEQLLDRQTHGPECTGPMWFMGAELKNKPKICPACGNTRLKEEFGPNFSLPKNPGDAKELNNFTARFRKSKLSSRRKP